jgi:DNA polymerase III epsilon subunit-like protein
MNRSNNRLCRHFWLDTETTGLDGKKHFAFQLSYLIEEKGEILLRRTLEMRPDDGSSFEFDPEAEKIHGYSKATILALPPESKQFPQLIADLEQYLPCPEEPGEFSAARFVLVGYQTEFDKRFLQALFCRNNPANSGLARYFAYFHPMICDVLQLAQNYRVAGLLDLPHLSLDALCAYFGISTEGAHHSMPDILNTRAVFDRLIGMAGKAALAQECQG